MIMAVVGALPSIRGRLIFGTHKKQKQKKPKKNPYNFSGLDGQFLNISGEKGSIRIVISFCLSLFYSAQATSLYLDVVIIH